MGHLAPAHGTGGRSGLPGRPEPLAVAVARLSQRVSGFTSLRRASATAASSRSPTPGTRPGSPPPSRRSAAPPPASAPARRRSPRRPPCVSGSKPTRAAAAASRWSTPAPQRRGHSVDRRLAGPALAGRLLSFRRSHIRSTASAPATCSPAKTVRVPATIFAAAASDTRAASNRPSSSAMAACIATCRQHVAQLLQHLLVAEAPVDHLQQLVRLLQQVRPQGLVRLLPSHGQPSGARRRRASAKMAPSPSGYGRPSPSGRSGIADPHGSRAVHLGHVVQQPHQLVPPAIALAPQQQPVGTHAQAPSKSAL